MSKNLIFSYHTDKRAGIDYKEAIYMLREYQEIASQSESRSVSIVNIPLKKIEVYKTIFNHIATKKRLVYKAGSIFRSKASYRGTKIEENRHILYDFKHTVHPCIANDTPEILKEQEIALLVLKERKELSQKN